MDPLALFGLIALTVMMMCDTLEDKSPWFTLGLSVSCVFASTYCIWTTLAFRRWRLLRTG